MTFDFLNPHESPEQMGHVVDPFLSAWMEKISEYNLAFPLTHNRVAKQTVKSFSLESQATSSDWQPEITFTARVEEGIERGRPTILSQGFALSEGDAPFMTEKGNNLNAFTYEVRDEQEGEAYLRTERFLIVGSPSEDTKPQSTESLGLDEHRYLFKRVSTIPASSVGKPTTAATNKSTEARHDTGSDFMSPVVVEDFLKTVNTILQNAEKQTDVQAFLNQQSNPPSI